MSAKQTTLGIVGEATEAPSGERQAFDEWYRAYPRKRAPRDAWKAWRTAKHPPLSAMLATLEWQKRSAEWTKDGGAFVPYPATYLRRGQFEEEQESPRRLAGYCPFHATARNNGWRAPIPAEGCPECKHVAASRAERGGGVEHVVPTVNVNPPPARHADEDELRADFASRFPETPYPGYREALRAIVAADLAPIKRAGLVGSAVVDREPGEDG